MMIMRYLDRFEAMCECFSADVWANIYLYVVKN